MKLRKLRNEDAPYMLEWMHDESVVRHLSANFLGKTIEDCRRFIENNQQSDEDLNLAIADDKDIYMGTVSLKHIDKKELNAEFAITIRTIAMGKGYSAYGMREILRLGLEEMGLKNIFWCVSKCNERAIRFYDKNGYNRTNDVPTKIKMNYTNEQMDSFIWYVCEKQIKSITGLEARS